MMNMVESFFDSSIALFSSPNPKSSNMFSMLLSP
jgi:hypothetical protein